jgi:ABC-type branched-subunit amino acid transport system ATPase component/ABC-type branched-subunit amino acid transport system permease subunit
MLGVAFFSTQTLYFVLLGLASGSLVGLVALGIVLVYRSSGVLNFSTGSLGALAAFVCYNLHSGPGWPWAACITVGLVSGLVLGIVTQWVMGLFTGASMLVKLIALLGLFSIFQGIVALAWPGQSSTPTGFLPTTSIHLFGQLQIGEDRLILIGLALVLAAVLRYVYSSTSFGLATSAVAESRRVAAIGGWSPRHIELVNFAVAGVLSALAAICMAPIVSLDGSVLALTIVPALAAALVGRFSSFEITMGAAILIGILQGELALFQGNLANALGVSYLALGGVASAVPLVLIVAITVVRGRGRMARGELLAKLPWPGDGRRSPLLLLGAAVVGTVLLFAVPAWGTGLIITFSTGILILSVIVVTGYVGQLSLCQFAFAGFGAWAASRLVAAQGLPFSVALVCGVVAAALLGLVFGLPALRVRGAYLAVTTLALALMIDSVIFENGSLTGGFAGTTVPEPTLFGISLNPIGDPARYGTFVLLLFVLTGAVVANLRRGRVGRRLLAVRSNERVAASLGVNVYGSKLFAFGLAAGIAALAGVCIGFSNPVVEFQSFSVFGSITAVEFAVIGGIGWASGSLMGSTVAGGALVAVIVTEVTGGSATVNSWLELLAGLAVIAGLHKSPDGIAALISRGPGAALRRRVASPRWVRPERAGDVPSSGLVAATTAGAERPAPVEIEVRELTVRFGGVLALDHVSFTLHPGEVLGLIGPNGAGKTTLLDAVSGFTSATDGSILLDGIPLERWSPERRARAGISRSWQAVELFDGLTVRDNLFVAADDKALWRYVTDLVHPGIQRTSPAMQQVIDELGLAECLDERPSALPQGVARLAGIARAIVSEPRALLLDEPCAGLDAGESAELGVAIRQIAARSGIGILLVEHDVPLLMNTCDRIVVLDFGRKIAEGRPTEVANDPAVVAAYLGEFPEGDESGDDSIGVPEPLSTGDSR